VGEKADLAAKTAYEDAAKSLYYFHEKTSMENATKLYKIAGPAISVIPVALIENPDLSNQFIMEHEENDQLKDPNELLSAVLTFAYKHNEKQIAQSAINFKLDASKKFVTDHFDWICEEANDNLLMRIIINVADIREDKTKADYILKKLATNVKIHTLIIDGNDQIRPNPDFFQYIIKWAAENSEHIKDTEDLITLTYAAENDNLVQLLQELAKRNEWRRIAYIRTKKHGREGRHLAQETLDCNVATIPLSTDDGNQWNIDPSSECGPGVFALIATIGLDENSRLTAIERVKNEGISNPEKTFWAYCLLYRSVLSDQYHTNSYKNPTITKAAEDALKEIKQAMKKQKEANKAK